MKLIDVEALFKQTCEWVDEAQMQLNKYVIGTIEWERWNAILKERTAFKHDILDAPTIEAEPVRHGKWIKKINEDTGYPEYFCENCRCVTDKRMFYCGFCGARMDLED